MKIAIIGTGYVGLVSGACFAEFGFNVICVDKDQRKIDNLNNGIMPIYEMGLEDIVKKNKANLSFTTDVNDAVKNSEIIFLAVGTPSDIEGKTDLSYINAATDEIANAMDEYKVIVMKSTVPVGTGAKVYARIKEIVGDIDFDVVSNPEFLQEGVAVENFMNPDRVIVGVESEKAKEIISRIYRPLFEKQTPILFSNRKTAEMIKYAANCFLATKITFINQVADICEEVGADVERVAEGIGIDKRIGAEFLRAGPGYGGSCFPKDTMALTHTAKEVGKPITIVDTLVAANEARKKQMAEKITKACGGSVANKKIAILGLTFKPNTDDMRDSPSLIIISELLANGANIQTYDPMGMPEAKEMLTSDNILWCENAYDAMNDAECLVIVTEWSEFRSLDLEKVKQLLAKPNIVDLRNIYERNTVEEYGFKYTCVGRP